MKKHYILIVFIAIAIIGLTGCKKTKEITCSLYASETTPAAEMNVIYTATQTGDGSIAALSYVTIAGTVTVQNPTLPWTITVAVLTSTKVAMSATGNVKNGSLKISYDGSAGGSTIRGSDFCEQQTN